MKKLLAVILSVMMLFGALSISTSAENYGETNFWGINELKLSGNQVVLCFELKSGKITSGIWAYDIDNKTFDYKEVYEGEFFYMVPDNRFVSQEDMDKGILPQSPGTSIQLPDITPPSGQSFNGWATSDGQIYVGGTVYTIPAYAVGGSTKIIKFTADYSLLEPEEDTMGGVLDILVKVFGAIVGLLFFSDEHGSDAIEEGMQLMQKLIGGLFE